MPLAPRRSHPARPTRREDHGRRHLDPNVGWLDALARQAHTVGSRVGFAALGVLLVLATAWFRRWRHLVIWMISIGIAGALLQGLELVSLRPRPFGVRQLASWEGYATPSIPSGAIAILAIGVAYMLVVPGEPRLWAKAAAAAAIAITGLLRIYLGVDHFTDVVFGAIVGVSIPLAAFRAFAPNDLFPVSYGRHGRRRTSTSAVAGGRRSAPRCRTSSGSLCTTSRSSGWRAPAARPR